MIIFKRLFFVGFLTISCIAGLFAFSAEMEMYKNLYRNSNSWEDRLNIIKELAFSSGEEVADPAFFTDVLDHLVSDSQNLKTSTEKYAWNESASLVAKKMGESRNIEAQDNLWKLYELSTDPHTEAEALIALGQIRSPIYYDRILNLLQELNLGIATDKDYAEQIAYGAIISLGKYGNETAYKVVFLAKVGWYTKKTRDIADRVLPSLSDNPAPLLISIINDPVTQFPVKSAAFSFAIRKESTLSAEDKAKVAISAYSYSQSLATADTAMQHKKASMVSNCLQMLITAKDHSPEVVPCLKESTKTIYSTEERLKAITALGINGTDAATEILSDIMQEYNNRRIDGPFGNSEEVFVRTLIPALGSTHNQKARPQLSMVTKIGPYTNAIKALASKALKELASE